MSQGTVQSEARATVGLREATLRNRHLELTLDPNFGCHWSRLRSSVRGRWLDLLDPAVSGDAGPGRAGNQGGRGGRKARGSAILAPWSNRISGARFEFRGETHTLRANHPDGTSIHGDVRTRPWTVETLEPELFEASLDTREFDEFNYPFGLRFVHRVALAGEKLTVELAIENLDDRPSPVGVGYHPYFRRRLTERDRDVIVQVPASRVYPLESCLPTGPAEPVDEARDLRRLELLGDRALDDVFTELISPESDGGIFRLIWPGTGLEARFELDPSFGHVIVYSPLGDDGAPSDFVAVEPVSNVNDGFNLLARGWEGTGVKVLEPGESWDTRWSLSVGDV